MLTYTIKRKEYDSGSEEWCLSDTDLPEFDFRYSAEATLSAASCLDKYYCSGDLVVCRIATRRDKAGIDEIPLPGKLMLNFRNTPISTIEMLATKNKNTALIAAMGLMDKDYIFHHIPRLLFERGYENPCSRRENMLTRLAAFLYDPRESYYSTEIVSLFTGSDSQITDHLRPILSRFI